MDKTTGARRRQLLAAVSVLGVSLGMADSAQADQSSHKVTSQHSIKYGGQSSFKSQSSLKSQGQSSLKYQGQSSLKYQAGQSQNSFKTQ